MQRVDELVFSMTQISDPKTRAEKTPKTQNERIYEIQTIAPRK